MVGQEEELAVGQEAEWAVGQEGELAVGQEEELAVPGRNNWQTVTTLLSFGNVGAIDSASLMAVVACYIVDFIGTLVAR